MAGPNRGMPPVHQYIQADLRPTLKDPRCDPLFPLACYWPVYLGNFWCENYSQHAVRIQEYFGSKGLLVRMVFGRNFAYDLYVTEQRRCSCYDFLVYFVSQEDAQAAIFYCHRDKYYGHRLNVFSGRTPEFFDTSISVKHKLVQPGRLVMAEQVFEQHIYNISKAKMRCIVKHSSKNMLVEYCSTEDRTMAIKYCKIAAPELIQMNRPKQRFLEKDVEKEIMAWMNINPAFNDMLPPGNILQALLNGYIPQNTMTWKTLSKVPIIRKICLFGPEKRRKKLRQPIYTQARQFFGIEVDTVYLNSEEVRTEKQDRKLEAKAAYRY